MIKKITSEHRKRIFSAKELNSSETERLIGSKFDACVIGSGPGGAVAAATLATAGMKVALIERGPFLAADQFNFRVLDMTNRSGHLELTSGFRTILYQGNLLGGGSIIYGGVAMKPAKFIFDEWQELSGVSAINSETLSPHYQHIAKVMSITRQTRELENRSNAIVREMADALGKPNGLETVDRYTQGCAGVGLCNFGCGFDLKGNMINSFIPIGLETGNLTIFTECEAVNINGGQNSISYQADGVNIIAKARASGEVIRRATIKANHIIVATGAFFSSALLLRSNQLPQRQRIGEKIYLQPHAQIFALFDEPITRPGVMMDGQYIPYHGVPAIYNFTGFLEQYNFFWLASILFPANLASFISHLPPDQHFQLMQKFHQTMSITLTIRDNPAKSRIVLKDNRAQLDYHESRADIESMRQCFLKAAEGFLKVGARQVFLPLLRPPKIEKLADLKQIERLQFGYQDLILYSDHTNSGNPYGANAGLGVCDPTGKIFGTENVYLTDASLFPSAAGINPSWTIMALSHRVATGIAERAGVSVK